MFVNFDGEPLVLGSHLPNEIITDALRPDLVREARKHWAVENYIYQFGHRGNVAVTGGRKTARIPHARFGKGILPIALGGRSCAYRWQPLWLCSSQSHL